MVILFLLIIFLLTFYYFINQAGWVDIILDVDLLKKTLLESGSAGVFVVIGLMAFAIVFNPIPSAPIALVSGAVYGHLWGTVYIVIGAQLGAMIAFFFARLAGQHLVCRLLGKQVVPEWLGSQRSMVMAVLFSRLMPFISFDLVSYGAGLTNIKWWGFSLATMFGLLPASFFLAHVGSEMAVVESSSFLFYSLILGFLVLLPLIYVGFKQLWKKF